MEGCLSREEAFLSAYKVLKRGLIQRKLMGFLLISLKSKFMVPTLPPNKASQDDPFIEEFHSCSYL